MKKRSLAILIIVLVIAVILLIVYLYPKLTGNIVISYQDTCKENDYGDNSSALGTLTYYYATPKLTRTYTDYCLNSTRLTEYFCGINPTSLKSRPYDCKNGCSKGACITKDFFINAGKPSEPYTAYCNGGDNNHDGTVDVVDLNNVYNNIGCSGVCVGDGNNDSVVDVVDLNNVYNNFGGLSCVPSPPVDIEICDKIVSSCQVLNETGKIYCLDRNVSTTGTCFTIKNKNITLNCRGYSITGLANMNKKIGISAKGDSSLTIKDTIIKNCNIKFDGGFYPNRSIGIMFENLSNSKIINSAFTNVDTSVSLKNSDFMKVDNLTFLNNSYGVSMGDCRYSTVSNLFGNNISNFILSSVRCSFDNYTNIRSINGINYASGIAIDKGYNTILRNVYSDSAAVDYSGTPVSIGYGTRNLMKNITIKNVGRGAAGLSVAGENNSIFEDIFINHTIAGGIWLSEYTYDFNMDQYNYNNTFRNNIIINVSGSWSLTVMHTYDSFFFNNTIILGKLNPIFVEDSFGNMFVNNSVTLAKSSPVLVSYSRNNTFMNNFFCNNQGNLSCVVNNSYINNTCYAKVGCPTYACTNPC